MMRIELVKRPQHSALFSALSPFIALFLTLIAGAILFSLLGKNPVSALYYYFVEPLTEIWSWHELLVKAAPLILIAVGLSVCFLSNNWNIGAEGQLIMGAIAGSILPVVFPDFQGWYVLPIMLVLGMAGGMAYATIPAFLKVRFNTNEILTSLMLVYVAQLFLDWIVRGPWRNPQGFNFPETVQFNASAILPEIWAASGRAHWGFILAIVAALLVWFMLSRTLSGFEIKVLGRRIQRRPPDILRIRHLRCTCRVGRDCRSIGRCRATAHDNLAGLRLYRDHRCVSWPSQSAWYRCRRAGAGTVLSWR
jgi:ABC-type uncharacterized transport system permease subunit